MKIIDFHTHVFPFHIAKKAIDSLVKASGGAFPPVSDGTVEGLKRNMENFGVDISVVQPVVTKPSQLRSLNEWNKSIQCDKIISFGGIYPKSETYKEDIDYIVSSGFKGIKLHPEYQDFVVNDKELLKVYDYALSRGLMILFHAGFDPAFRPPTRSNPKMFREIIDELGGGVIIAAHLGGQSQWDDVEKYLCGTNIYMDTSMGFKYYSKEQFVRIVKAHGADKILFGSDSPWSNAKEEIASINSLNLKDEEKEAIFCKNAQRLLGL